MTPPARPFTQWCAVNPLPMPYPVVPAEVVARLDEARAEIVRLREALDDFRRRADDQAALVRALFELLKETHGLTEAELLDHLRGSDDGVLSDIRESQKLSEETENKLTDAIKEFKKGFAATGGGSVVPDEHVEPLDEDEVAKESVQVHKPAPPEQKKK